MKNFAQIGSTFVANCCRNFFPDFKSHRTKLQVCTNNDNLSSVYDFRCLIFVRFSIKESLLDSNRPVESFSGVLSKKDWAGDDDIKIVINIVSDLTSL